MNNTSGIKSVSCYTASPVETCDRCSAAIKYVTVVSYQDGFREKYGMECINKVLAGYNSLKTLFRRNEKRLRKYQRWLEILSLPEDQMPIDERGYYDRGVYFVADDDGNAICGLGQSGHYAFHPSKVDLDKADFDGSETFDMRPWGSAWEPKTLENWQKRCRNRIERDKEWLRQQIAWLEIFLARVLKKGLSLASESDKRREA